jgi:tetratricopeptide (TPR) repeat protein
MNALNRRIALASCLLAIVLAGCGPGHQSGESVASKPAESATDFAKDRPEIQFDLPTVEQAKKEAATAPKDPKKIMNLAGALYQAKRWADSEVEFAKIVGDSRRGPTALYYMGHAQIAQNKIEPAIATFRKLSGKKLEPQKLAEVYREIGYLHEELRQYDKAIDPFRQSLKHDPDQPYLIFALGTLLAHKGDAAGAREQFEKALSKAPSDSFKANCYAAFGRLEREAGRREKARELIEKALKLDPQNAAAAGELKQLR